MDDFFEGIEESDSVQFQQVKYFKNAVLEFLADLPKEQQPDDHAIFILLVS